jgi:hypothetical protein
MIPDGAQSKRQMIEHFPVILSKFGCALPWFQAATLVNNQDPGVTAKVYIDWVKFYANDTLLFETDFSVDGPFTEGGIYTRSPTWFATDEHQTIQNATISNSILTIDVAPWPNNVLHWWCPRQPIAFGSRLYVEVRVKVEGDVGFQIGADYWTTLNAPYSGYDITGQTTNNVEAWKSDWITDTGGEFVTVKYPNLSPSTYTSAHCFDIPYITISGTRLPLRGFSDKAIKVVFDGGNYNVWVKGQE